MRQEARRLGLLVDKLLDFEGFRVRFAEDGLAGLESILQNLPDLVVLDLMLPRKNGFEICREIRQRGITTPVIVLTARGQEVDKIRGLELGADDYITKPFSLAELVARIRAVLRRSHPEESSDTIQRRMIAMDLRKHQVLKGNTVVELTELGITKFKEVPNEVEDSNRHIASVNRANALFVTRLAGKAMVSVQNAVCLSRYTEPQPDIVLARPRDDYYSGQRISPEDTFLVVEISDTTLRYDRNRKMPLYAKAGVSEVWIENLQSDVILIYRDPGPETYATSLAVHRGESISLAAFPEILFTVDELLG